MSKVDSELGSYYEQSVTKVEQPASKKRQEMAKFLDLCEDRPSINKNEQPSYVPTSNANKGLLPGFKINAIISYLNNNVEMPFE